ncbi:MAG: hypothetical protein AB1714_15665 [Acidobacteriota bacterium]
MPEPNQDPHGKKDDAARHRLQPMDRNRELFPLRRAYELTRCFLYWVPVSSFPLPQAQRGWLMRFMDLLVESLNAELGLQPEVFLQMKTLYPTLMDQFLNAQDEMGPMIGLLRKPGAPIPKPPGEEEVMAMSRATLTTMKPPDVAKYLPDYCYRFLERAERKQRELFFGHGGLTMIFLKPDDKPKPKPLPFPPKLKEHPDFKPIFQQSDPDKQFAKMLAIMDGFQAKSKEVFGRGLEKEPVYKGLVFILPLLQAADFFSQPADDVKQWFDVFDVFFCESPADRGMLLAMKPDFETQLVALIRQTTQEVGPYVER